MLARVLTVDDDPGVLDLVEDLLAVAGMSVERAGSCAQALEKVRNGFRGVFVLDVRLPDGLGPDLLPELTRHAPECPVIFLTGYSSTSMALDSIQGGAFDFIDKTQLASRLVQTVQGAWASYQSAAAPGMSEHPAFDGIITRSASMRAVFRSLVHALESKVPVLIRGESGTGKELIAQAVHHGSPRRNGPFVAVNCAGIPDTLLEAELFGYERGAFTGAAGRKPGRFDLAQRGSLLLDEIGELDPSLQAKLLRVIQEGEYQRLGGLETLKSDVRLVSATNRNLEEEVARGRFREDLYYRLAVYTVELPPLRQRQGDIPLLVDFFLKRASTAEGKEVTSVDPMAMELLENYGFPGNVRQLENVIAHAVVAANTSELRMADLPSSFLRAVQLERRGQTPQAGQAWVPPSTIRTNGGDGPFPTLAQMEQAHCKAAIERADGNKALAARMLGISRMTLYRKLSSN